MTDPRYFTLLTEDDRIIPGSAVLTEATTDFLNDAYVIIEDDGYTSRIIDVQNWEKQRFRYVHYEYEALRPYDEIGKYFTITTCQLYHVDAAKTEQNCDHRPGIDKVNINAMQADPDDLSITGAMGRLYIFIHRLPTANRGRGQVDVYLRLPGSLTAKRLLDAEVRLQELVSNNQLFKLRSEYGREFGETYSSASRDVKYSIIRAALRNPQDQAAIKGAISLCRTEVATATVCQNLPVQQKATLCLSGNNLDNPRACQQVPVFTRADFERLIPRQLEVTDGDELQLSHDFYAQKFKLADEGYAEAMYKARLINTICALIRPDILTQYAKILPPLPPYLDLELIQRVMQVYLSINQKLIDTLVSVDEIYAEPFGIEIRMTGAPPQTIITLELIFQSPNSDLSQPTVASFKCNIECLPATDENLAQAKFILDAIETSKFMDDELLWVASSSQQANGYAYLSMINPDGEIATSYALFVSKILRKLFDYGFLDAKNDGVALEVRAGPVMRNFYGKNYLKSI